MEIAQLALPLLLRLIFLATPNMEPEAKVVSKTVKCC